jgi:hypothetical protein
MSQRNRRWAAVLLSFGMCAGATTVPTFNRDQRQNYISEAIQAFRQSPLPGIENLAQYISLTERSRCRAAVEALTVSCLEEESRKNCQTGRRNHSRCAVLSDVLIVNKVNEKQFVSRDERLALMRRSASGTFGSIFSRLLRRKYALLTSELLLTTREACDEADTKCLGREIDRYCLQNSDIKNVPWQACVGGIVSFMGSVR